MMFVLFSHVPFRRFQITLANRVDAITSHPAQGVLEIVMVVCFMGGSAFEIVDNLVAVCEHRPERAGAGGLDWPAPQRRLFTAASSQPILPRNVISCGSALLMKLGPLT